jgi:hypothetical protein
VRVLRIEYDLRWGVSFGLEEDDSMDNDYLESMLVFIVTGIRLDLYTCYLIDGGIFGESKYLFSRPIKLVAVRQMDL